MFIHLEAGNCQSGIDESKLNATTARVRQRQHSIVQEYRAHLLDGWDQVLFRANFQEKIEPFRCSECDGNFPKLSALFQHVGSNACDADLDCGAVIRLLTWLSKNHKY
jgi:hypothetical protein